MNLFTQASIQRLSQAGYQQTQDRKDGTRHWQTPDGDVLIEEEALRHLARAEYLQEQAKKEEVE